MESSNNNSFDSDFFLKIKFKTGKPEVGGVLISEPFLTDPNFHRSVVLMVSHDSEGSVGFVLNKPSDMPINEAVIDFPEFDAPVYFGGPVGQGSLFFIHTLGDAIPESKLIKEGLYWGGDFDFVKLLITNDQLSPNQIKFFIGYSGWAENQLQEELNEKSWITSEIKTEDILKSNSEKFWKKSMSKLGEKFKIMSTFPEDPTLN